MGEKYTAEFEEANLQLDQIKEKMSGVTSSTDSWINGIMGVNEAVKGINEGLDEIAEKEIIDPSVLETGKMLDVIIARLGKRIKDNGKDMTALVKASKDLSKMLKDAGYNMGDTDKKAQRVSKSFGNIKSSLNQVASAQTGLNLSLGGIILLLVEVFNMLRKIHGQSMMLAGSMGATKKDIKNASATMFDLRKNFALSYDEAYAISDAIKKVGISSEHLAEGSKKQITAYSMTTAILKEQVQMLDKLKHSKFSESVQGWADANKEYAITLSKVTKEQEKHKVNMKELALQNASAASYASELYSIQVKYGMNVSGSAQVVKGLTADYGKSHSEARKMYGTVLHTLDFMYSKEMKGKMPFDISADELIKDWTKLSEYAKVYKMDLYGVLSVYNMLLRSDTSKLLGLDKAPASIKKAIAETITSAPSKLQLGWKARLEGGAGTAAERALRFERTSEKEGPGYVLKRIMATMEEMVGNISSMGEAERANAEIKMRLIMKEVGFPEEAAVTMARSAMEGNMTSENIEEFSRAQLEEMARIRKSEENWSKNRGRMVDYAKEASIAATSTDKLIQQWIRDTLIPVVMGIYDLLKTIADSPLFGGTGGYAAEKQFKEATNNYLKKRGASEADIRKVSEVIPGASSRLTELATMELRGDAPAARLEQEKNIRAARFMGPMSRKEEMEHLAEFSKQYTGEIGARTKELQAQVLEGLGNEGTIRLLNAIRQNNFREAEMILKDQVNSIIAAKAKAHDAGKRKRREFDQWLAQTK